jgi:hypothetical protein
MAFSMLARRGLVITSYEENTESKNGELYKPILTHVFWGDTVDEAYEYAKSHLLTDYFFSSTMVGKMKWGGSTLYLRYSSKLLGISTINSEDVTEDLQKVAKKINKQQVNDKIPEIINKIEE